MAESNLSTTKPYGGDREAGSECAVPDRYQIGRSLISPRYVDFLILDAEKITADELLADMPRIQAALLHCLSEVHADVARRG